MKLKTTLLILIAILIVGCQTPITYKKPPANNPSDDATIKLVEAASSVSDSLSQLAEIQAASTPATNDKKLPDPNAYNLQSRASVDWNGPIESLVKRLATSNHYKLRVLGNAPAIPVLISVNVADETIANILRDADFQAGSRANIVIYPKQKVIELRYAKA